MKRVNLKAGALTAPLPPVLVTVGDSEKSNIITIGWTGILSTIPPRTYVSVRPERYSHGLLRERGEFVINLTTEKMAWAVDYAGIYTGAKVDKWHECGLTKAESKCVAPPTVAESPLALECKVTDVISMGTHDVFVADIVNVSCDESILGKDGRLELDRAGLLAYAHGEYFALGEKLGKFGFSTKKKQEKRYKNATRVSAESEKTGAEKQPFYVTAPGYKGRKGRKR
ncbi:MAG: flavin reductase family protein [Clostridia bacterium]|nr:flavin reductase family protein [Clostridia bacterium]